jgi:hypothetical protein
MEPGESRRAPGMSRATIYPKIHEHCVVAAAGG